MSDQPEFHITIQPGEVGVIVHFDDTARSFSKNGSPTIDGHRERAITKALLEAALRDIYDQENGIAKGPKS